MFLNPHINGNKLLYRQSKLFKTLEHQIRIKNNGNKVNLDHNISKVYNTSVGKYSSLFWHHSSSATCRHILIVKNTIIWTYFEKTCFHT